VGSSAFIDETLNLGLKGYGLSGGSVKQGV